MSLCRCEACGLTSHADWFCARLTIGQLQELSRYSSPMSLARKTTLEDALVEKWPVIAIIDGVLGMQHTLEDGRRTIAAYYTKGDIIDMRQRLAHMQGVLVSLTKARICRFQPATFQSVLETNHDAWTAVSENQREQNQLTICHAADLGKKKALEKLASFILECQLRGGGNGSSPVEVVIPMPRVNLADYMGLQPETVSRELRRLEEMGLIKVAATNKIVVNDATRLMRLANGAGDWDLAASEHLDQRDDRC